MLYVRYDYWSSGEFQLIEGRLEWDRGENLLT